MKKDQDYIDILNENGINLLKGILDLYKSTFMEGKKKKKFNKKPIKWSRYEEYK